METSSTFPFQNPNLSLDLRVNDLVSRLTLEEKIYFLHQRQPAVPRLGILPYKTGTEAIHGIAWLGVATVFPQAIGLASTWNLDLVKRVGAAAGDEVRGYFFRNRASCLNVWSPVVDLLRDPRAGRNEEGYSEDAFLTGQMSVAYCSGLRGDDPFYLKTAPSLKHFFAYNNEAQRDINDSNVDPRNLHEYYLKAFQPAIAANKATGVMTSYNFVNGRPNTLTPYLNSLVRQWTDQPLLIVSDAFAPSNIVNSQKYYATHPESHAAAIRAGLDSFTDRNEDTNFTFNHIKSALEQGLLTPADIDHAVRHIFSIRIRLGEFDPANPYAGITDSVLCSPAHQALAHEAACQQVVLLKNERNILPLDKKALTKIAVIGPRANEVLTDWYSGTLPYTITPLAAVQNKVGAGQIQSRAGVVVTYAADNAANAAVDIARAAEVALVFVGNRPRGDNGSWAGTCSPDEGKETIDRQSINLSEAQESLIQQVYAANPNTIVVLISSFPYALNWANANAPAIVWSSHAGQELGNALAEVLFGDYAPAGRLTQTWYASVDDLPDILEYDIIKANRTYQYFAGAPLYPFGHGLTYTTFEYDNLQLNTRLLGQTDQVVVSVDVTNTGSRASDEVVQLYVRAQRSRVKRPLKELKGFHRINLAPGQTQTVRFTLPASELVFWDVTREKWAVEAGDYDILIGRSSADIKLQTTLRVEGELIPNRNLNLLTRAENYDDYSGIKLVDETKPNGTAIGAAAADGWIAFKNVDLGSGVREFSASVSNAGPGPVKLEIRLNHPAGALVGTAIAPSTESVYSWTIINAAVSRAAGIHDVYLIIGSPLRIRSFNFHS